MDTTRHKEIEIEALKVLDDYEIADPVVNVAKIAEGQNVKIKEIEMPEGYGNVAGFYDKNTKAIYVEKKDPPQRKLFSIAHELGHLILQHQNATVLFRITREDAAYPLQEKEANSFAAHLLMPEFMLRKYMQKYNLTKADYGTMAKIFGVPVSSMLHQLERLK
ncbi:ImmA/IrrE family metallo-endopeptidase [Candidatus Parcubacteria bacterium]|nr:ImmA/IrrE family metallo-endopeptidase [Candidatus Parcubacteria bacterium]